MKELLKELKKISDEYKHLSEKLCILDGEEEYYPDNDIAIEDGMGIAYYRVALTIDKLIEKYKGE